MVWTQGYWRAIRDASVGRADPDAACGTVCQGACLFVNRRADQSSGRRRKRDACSYLKKKQGFLLVSHDRKLLDSCTDHTMALERSGIRIYRGNFSTWQREKKLRDQMELGKNEKLKKEIRHYEDAAREAGRWAGKKGEGKRPDIG